MYMRYLLAGAAFLVVGCAGGDEYRRVLDRAQAQNAAYDSITGIDSIQMATEYYDRHGSHNEKVRAYYILGCAYRDAGEAIKALEAYHHASERADTTDADCDYGLLMRVHAQAADLFYYQQLPYEMLGELAAQQRCALYAGNDMSAINAIEHRANAYYLLNDSDSIINIRRRASELYRQYGFYEESAQSLAPIIDILIERGEIEEARQCMDRYSSSRRFFKDGEPIPRKAMYYYSKGNYYMAVNKMDSAEVFFRKLLQPERTAQQKEAGYRGMFLLSWKQGQTDSIAKYADLLFRQIIPSIALVNADNIQQMHSLYNYNRVKHQTEELLLRDQLKNTTIALLFSMLLILVMAAVNIYRRLLRRRRIQNIKYDALLSQYHQERQHQQRIDIIEKMLGMVVKRPHLEVSVNSPGNQIISEQKNDYHKEQ